MMCTRWSFVCAARVQRKCVTFVRVCWTLTRARTCPCLQRDRPQCIRRRWSSPTATDDVYSRRDLSVKNVAVMAKHTRRPWSTRLRSTSPIPATADNERPRGLMTLRKCEQFSVFVQLLLFPHFLLYICSYQWLHLAARNVFLPEQSEDHKVSNSQSNWHALRNDVDSSLNAF